MRDKVQVPIELTWAREVKVSSSLQFVLSRGSRELFGVTRILLLDCANSGGNRVMVDFGPDTVNLRSSAHVPIFDAWEVRVSAF